jgi:hypothetical protein
MRILLCLLVLALASVNARAQTPASPRFTYQGQLSQNGLPVNGSRDLAFVLFSEPSGGVQLGTGINAPAWPIVEGLFTIQLQFPDIGAVAQPWLEVRVEGRPILPRQRIPVAPIAQFALSGITGSQGPEGPQGPGGLPGEPRLLPNRNCLEDQFIGVISSFGTVCRPRGISGWRRISADFTVSNLAVEQRRVSCGPGEVVLSGGVEHLQRDASGNAAGSGVRAIESFPTFADGLWAWQVAVYNTGLAVPLRAFVTCAKS